MVEKNSVWEGLKSRQTCPYPVNPVALELFPFWLPPSTSVVWTMDRDPSGEEGGQRPVHTAAPSVEDLFLFFNFDFG